VEPHRQSDLLPVEIDGDNDDDGTIDQKDRQIKSTHPIVMQQALNKTNYNWQRLIIRKIPISGVPVKLIKTGTESIIIQSYDVPGKLLMDQGQSESIDISQYVSQGDYTVMVRGITSGTGTIGLEVGTSGTGADPMPIQVLNADVIFRFGNQTLANLINFNVTHGGFDSGDPLPSPAGTTNIYDIGGNGTEETTRAQFYANSGDGGATKRRVSFSQNNYMAHRIWKKIYDNMENGAFDNPTGPIPWNLFTTSDNYDTSNCLEWMHKQWQRAVREVHDELTDAQQISKFESTYYSGEDVANLVPADTIEISGQASVVEAEIQGLETAANYSDIIFCNKGSINRNIFYTTFEGTSTLYYIPSSPLLQADYKLNTITPRSFFESPFFEEVIY
jgi:hypothetical protein